MWRLYLEAVRFFGRLAGPLLGPLLLLDWRAGERLCAAATAAGVVLILITPAMVPAQSPSQSEFERLRTQVEGNHERLNRAEVKIDAVSGEVIQMRVNIAESLPSIKTDVNGLKWIVGILGGALMACLPVAFGAGRWYQKTEHISGEHRPVKAR